MFPNTYFAQGYFPDRYFPPGVLAGAAALLEGRPAKGAKAKRRRDEEDVLEKARREGRLVRLGETFDGGDGRSPFVGGPQPREAVVEALRPSDGPGLSAFERPAPPLLPDYSVPGETPEAIALRAQQMAELARRIALAQDERDIEDLLMLL